jgi:cytochrome b6-f complex iron-sulfur subunit
MSKPIKSDAVGNDSLDRRLFIATALGGVGACYIAALGYPVYRYLASPVEHAEVEAAITEVTLPDAQKLPVRSALVFKFGPFISLLIHHGDDTWSAFDAKCSHLGCTVKYEPDKQRIYCECHGGMYDPKTGKNTGGPPPKPLRAYEVKLTQTGVLVTRAKA